MTSPARVRSTGAMAWLAGAAPRVRQSLLEVRVLLGVALLAVVLVGARSGAVPDVASAAESAYGWVAQPLVPGMSAGHAAQVLRQAGFQVQPVPIGGRLRPGTSQADSRDGRTTISLMVAADGFVHRVQYRIAASDEAAAQWLTGLGSTAAMQGWSAVELGPGQHRYRHAGHTVFAYRLFECDPVSPLEPFLVLLDLQDP